MSRRSVFRTTSSLIVVLGFAGFAPPEPPRLDAPVPPVGGSGKAAAPPMVPYYVGPTIAPTFPVWMPGFRGRPSYVDLSWLPGNLRNPALGRLLLRAHDGPVTCVAFSGDGSTLASGSLDKTVILWDLATQRMKVRLRGHSAPVTSLVFSPDGTTLATGSQDRSVILWDLPAGRPRATLKGHGARVSALAISPDGATLAVGSHDGKIDLLDVASGRVQRTIDGQRGPVWELAFTPDGRTLAAGHFEMEVVLWDALTGHFSKTRRAWHNSDKACAASLFGGSTLMLSRGAEGWIWLQDVKQGRPLGVLTGHAGAVRSLALGPGGKLLASGGIDKTVRVWDVPAELNRWDCIEAYIDEQVQQARAIEEERRAKARKQEERSREDR
jgi:WD40 repeat protein